jgi:hypothetical protein
VSNAAIFRGDAEGFVDMLIAASRSKPVASPQLCALQGRELVPWQSEDSCSSAALLDMPLESSSSIRCVSAAGDALVPAQLHAARRQQQ